MKTKPPGVFLSFQHDQTSRNIQSISCISANSKHFDRSILHKKARNPFLLCLQGSIIKSVVCKIGKGKYQLWNRSRGFWSRSSSKREGQINSAARCSAMECGMACPLRWAILRYRFRWALRRARRALRRFRDFLSVC